MGLPKSYHRGLVRPWRLVVFHSHGDDWGSSSLGNPETIITGLKKSLGNPETIITGLFLKKVKNPMTNQQFVRWSPQKIAHDMIFSRAILGFRASQSRASQRCARVRFPAGVWKWCLSPNGLGKSRENAGNWWKMVRDFMAIQWKMWWFSPKWSSTKPVWSFVSRGNTPNIGIILGSGQHKRM